MIQSTEQHIPTLRAIGDPGNSVPMHESSLAGYVLLLLLRSTQCYAYTRTWRWGSCHVQAKPTDDRSDRVQSTDE